MPSPPYASGVKQFCGMVQYLARFLPNLANDLEPVRKLTRKGEEWNWSVSQTLFGNPKGPVELGNPNTCAETKLCLNFILFRLKK